MVRALLLFLLFGILVAAQQPRNNPTTPAGPPAPPDVTAFPPMPRPHPSNHLPAVQTLVYGAEWRVFNAGTASLRLEQTAPATGPAEGHVIATADAAGAV